MMLAGTLPALAGEVIDRIVATVNGHIILQSDWDDAVRYEAFIGGHPMEGLSATDRKAALDRLIDQELLREQMRPADAQRAAQEPELGQQIQTVRKQYAEAASEAGWHALLEKYGLDEGVLRQRIAVQIDLSRLVDDRLRPTIQIDTASIERYYNQSLLPQLRQAGAAEVALADVTPKIKELLTQQKLDEMLAEWLRSLRASSDIRMEGLTPAAPEAR